MLQWKKEDQSATGEQGTIALTRTNIVGVCTVFVFPCRTADLPTRLSF